MDREKYESQLEPLAFEIDEITGDLRNLFNQNVELNLETIEHYALSPNFTFFDRNGNLIHLKEPFYVELSPQSEVYLNTDTGNVVVFEYMDTIDYEMPNDIDEVMLKELFENADFYEDAMHIVGLDGIQSQFLDYQKQKLKKLRDLNK